MRDDAAQDHEFFNLFQGRRLLYLHPIRIIRVMALRLDRTDANNLYDSVLIACRAVPMDAAGWMKHVAARAQDGG